MRHEDLTGLGSRIKDIRNNRGLTLEQLADLSGTSARYISSIEKGVANPSFEILYALVKALGVSFDFIFYSTSDPIEKEIAEITSLYRACPEQRHLILTAVRAMANEMIEEQKLKVAETKIE